MKGKVEWSEVTGILNLIITERIGRLQAELIIVAAEVSIIKCNKYHNNYAVTA
jgi:hypothetical protein